MTRESDQKKTTTEADKTQCQWVRKTRNNGKNIRCFYRSINNGYCHIHLIKQIYPLT